GPHDEQEQRPLPVLLQDHPPEDAPALPAVGDDRAEEPEDRARCTDREPYAERVGDDEARDARDREDDDEPRGPVDLDGGAELADPEDVEQNVEQPAVEVDR